MTGIATIEKLESRAAGSFRLSAPAWPAHRFQKDRKKDHVPVQACSPNIAVASGVTDRLRWATGHVKILALRLSNHASRRLHAGSWSIKTVQIDRQNHVSANGSTTTSCDVWHTTHQTPETIKKKKMYTTSFLVFLVAAEKKGPRYIKKKRKELEGAKP